VQNLNDVGLVDAAAARLGWWLDHYVYADGGISMGDWEDSCPDGFADGLADYGEMEDMFARIAPGYDDANKVMSMGIDRIWRRIALRALGSAADGDVMDLCAGTMDFSAALAGRSRSVVAVDFCQPMLDAGRAKIPDEANVRILCADAREIPLPDASLDGIVAGFGIRNVPEPERALAECGVRE
jgi:ubiquinone/menaquinone biosynthesis C-methylase UbiE